MKDGYPPPFGVPDGPELATPALLESFLEGRRRGKSTEFHIEGDVLMATVLDTLAIRLPGAMLVRDDIHPDVEPYRATFEQALTTAGMSLVERDSVLAGVVGIEVSGLRGAAWSLWAFEAQAGKDALQRRAAADLGGTIDQEGVRLREEVDATLAVYEREFDQ